MKGFEKNVIGMFPPLCSNIGGAVEKSVTGKYKIIYRGCIKKGNPTLACHCALITGCMNVTFS